MILFLIGLPGSGKSFLGKKLSESTLVPFFDLDEEIEKGEGMSVQQIFKNLGQNHFRLLEAEYLSELLELKNGIVATGGGTPCFFNNLELMQSKGVVVFLDEPLEVIEGRMTAETNQRPLFENANPKEKLEELNTQRRGIYLQANVVLQGAQYASVEEKVKHLTQWMK